MTFINDLKPYNKFIVAILGAVLNVVVQFYGSNPYVQFAVGLLTAVGVYAVPNRVV